MNAFFHWLCNPVVIFIILLIPAVLFLLFKRERRAFILFGVGIGWILLISVTPLAQWAVYLLEKQYTVYNPVPERLKAPVHILVLGGGHSNAPDLPASLKLSRGASARLVEAIRIHRQIPGSKLVGSGNSVSKQLTIAEVQSLAAIELGVFEGDTLQSRSPVNTSEEIQAYKNRFGNEGTLILVTSAIHMPRAMYLCERYGLQATPAPSDFYLKKDSRKSIFNFKPSAMKLEMMEKALHEYLGMVKEKLVN